VVLIPYSKTSPSGNSGKWGLNYPLKNSPNKILEESWRLAPKDHIQAKDTYVNTALSGVGTFSLWSRFILSLFKKI
jgi:hypothetical protein